MLITRRNLLFGPRMGHTVVLNNILPFGEQYIDDLCTTALTQRVSNIVTAVLHQIVLDDVHVSFIMATETLPR